MMQQLTAMYRQKPSDSNIIIGQKRQKLYSSTAGAKAFALISERLYERLQMIRIRKLITGYGAACMLAVWTAGWTAAAFPVYADSIEADEYGVAYVLKDDGSRDYSNVPALPTTDENAVSEQTIIDGSSYDLGLNGPTRDQSTVEIPDGMSRETYEALYDDVISWNELPDLIEYRNPTYVKYFKQADSSLNTMNTAYEEFRSQMREQMDELDSTIDALEDNQKLISSVPGNTVSLYGQSVSKDAALTQLETGLAAAKKGKRSIGSAVSSTRMSLYNAGKSVDTALKPVKNQLTATVETLVIQYKILETNRSLAEEQVKLYESLYESYRAMEAESISTDIQTKTYLNQLNTAKKTLAELDAGIAMLRKNILVQCGYDADAAVSIGDIPDPDRSFMEGRDTAADRKTAVDGNSSVISAGSLSSYQKSSDGMKSRELGENEARAKAGSAFDALKTEVERQLILADSADASLRKAELAEQTVKLKNDMGMISSAEYAGLNMQLVSFRAGAELTRLNLIQAITNYKWAVQGVMSIEG